MSHHDQRNTVQGKVKEGGGRSSVTARQEKGVGGWVGVRVGVTCRCGPKPAGIGPGLPSPTPSTKASSGGMFIRRTPPVFIPSGGGRWIGRGGMVVIGFVERIVVFRGVSTSKK